MKLQLVFIRVGWLYEFNKKSGGCFTLRRFLLFIYCHRGHRKSLKKILPPDPIILTMITTSSPETSMFPIKPNRIDGAAGAVFETQGISHTT